MQRNNLVAAAAIVLGAYVSLGAAPPDPTVAKQLESYAGPAPGYVNVYKLTTADRTRWVVIEGGHPEIGDGLALRRQELDSAQQPRGIDEATGVVRSRLVVRGDSLVEEFASGLSRVRLKFVAPDELAGRWVETDTTFHPQGNSPFVKEAIACSGSSGSERVLGEQRANVVSVTCTHEISPTVAGAESTRFAPGVGLVSWSESTTYDRGGGDSMELVWTGKAVR